MPFSQLHSPIFESETPGVGSVSCTLTSPPGDSRTSGLADLAPTWLKTSTSTQDLKKSDPFLPLFIHKILFTSSRHRARRSRSLSNWFPGCEIGMTLILRAEHFLHLVSWLLLARVVTQSWWHLRVTWETFPNYQYLAPTPDQVSNSEDQSKSSCNVHQSGRPWLLALRPLPPHHFKGRDEASLTVTLGDIMSWACQHSLPSLGSATCRVGASGQLWVEKSGAYIYGEVHGHPFVSVTRYGSWPHPWVGY